MMTFDERERRMDGMRTVREAGPYNGGRPMAAPTGDASMVPDMMGGAVPSPVGGVMPVSDPMGAVPYGRGGGLADESLLRAEAPPQVVGAEQVREAMATLMKYKAGKATLDERIVSHEEWYRLRHWAEMRKPRVGEDGKPIVDEVEPASAWMFNAIANKHADSMDNYPRPTVMPREAGDVDEAKVLSSILPPLMEQCGFEKTYSDEQYRKIKHGTGVYGVFWEPTASSGMGEITVQAVDILNLFWEPGVTDIQDSSNLFMVKLWNVKAVEERYPQLKDRLAVNNSIVSRYLGDDTTDTADKVMVVDWYYKRTVNGKTVLHYCKFVDETVLFASENTPEMAQRGFYDHGRYPFVLDVLFPIEGTPVGFGYIAVSKSPQEYIDRGDQAVLTNMLEGAQPRYFVKNGSRINEEEFADRKKKLVHYEGEVRNIYPVETKPLASIYVSVKENKVNELKEVTGNRDASTGGTSSGVTAAAAIAAMQEAGSKLSRDANKGSYRAYRQVIELVIELIRQFYQVPHYFRIVGEGGQVDFQRYTNKHLRGQITGVDRSGMPTYRIPLFDIEISAERSSPYSRMAANELALQFYNAGFFAPQNSDAALACLDLMDFDRKDMVMGKIAQNGTLYKQLMSMTQMAMGLAQTVDQMSGGQTNYTMQVQQAAQGVMQGMRGGGGISPAATARAAGQEVTKAGESSTTKKARQRVAESTAV